MGWAIYLNSAHRLMGLDHYHSWGTPAYLKGYNIALFESRADARDELRLCKEQEDWSFPNARVVRVWVKIEYNEGL